MCTIDLLPGHLTVNCRLVPIIRSLARNKDITKVTKRSYTERTWRIYG